MRNLKVIFEYDGTRYQGWQKPQTSAGSSTLCSKFTDLLTRITDQPVTLFCAEKTDPGVHAYSQAISFQTETVMSCQTLLDEMNHYLPNDIVVLSVTEEDPRFRSDLSYKNIRYIYHLYYNNVLPVSQREYAYSISSDLDLVKMKQAASLLIGKHDFKNFSTGKKKKGTEKTLSSVHFVSYENELYILLDGNHFLHQMPSLLIATLIEIGTLKRSPDCINQILSGTECPSSPLPNKGLFLDVEHRCPAIDQTIIPAI